MKHAAALDFILGQIRWYARQAEHLRQIPATTPVEVQDREGRVADAEARCQQLGDLVCEVAPELAGRVAEIRAEARR